LKHGDDWQPRRSRAFLVLGTTARSGRVFLAVFIFPFVYAGPLLGLWGNLGDDSPIAFAIVGSLFSMAIATLLIFVGVFIGGWIGDARKFVKARRPRRRTDAGSN
jgi:hypothetical protein